MIVTTLDDCMGCDPFMISTGRYHSHMMTQVVLGLGRWKLCITYMEGLNNLKLRKYYFRFDNYADASYFLKGYLEVLREKDSTMTFKRINVKV